MPSRTSDQTEVRRRGARTRDVLGRTPLAMLSSGVLTGYGLVTVGEEAVSVPFVGDVSGVVAGAVALLVAAVLYTQAGGKDCGCSGDCNGSCSVDS